MFHAEVKNLVDQVNRLLPAGSGKLYAPDLKFHRAIGDFKGQSWSVNGEELSPEAHAKHLSETLPSKEDEAVLRDIFSSGETWIEPREPKTN